MEVAAGGMISNTAMRGLALLVLILLPLACAALYPLLGRSARLRKIAWAPALSLVLLELVGFVILYAAAAPHGIATFRWPFLRSFGVDLALRLDGLALLFCVLVTGIGLAVVAFSALYIPHDFEQQRIARSEAAYYGLLMFFMSSMLGLVCADDLFTLYVFWEATSVSSFLLIALDLRKDQPRKAALKAFVITASAGILLFAAFAGIRIVTGTTAISTLIGDPGMAAILSAHVLAPLMALGIAIGAFAKSALVPLHIWLPDSMAAPTPVSAYLHSATMVAAGVFLLARLSPLLSPIPVFGTVLVAVGAVTLVVAAVVAVRQTKLKALLAYSTISQYGLIAMLLGLRAYGAAVFYMAGHAVLKSGLFLVAGIISYATGKDDLRQVGGLARSYPVSAVCAGVLAFGLAGLPATSGFWMKELFYKAVAEEQRPLWIPVAVAGGVLTLTYMFRFFWQTFGGATRAGQGTPERELIPLLIPVSALAALVVAVGISPRLGLKLTDLGASAAAASPVATEVSVHFPPDAAMWMTLVTYALGLMLFLWFMVWSRATEDLARERALATASYTASILRRLGAASLYDSALPALDKLSRRLGRAQSGRLAHYLLVLMAIPVVLGALFLYPQSSMLEGLPAPPELTGEGSALVVVAAAAVLLALTSVLVESRLVAILAIGGIGFVLALLFSILRAPDVALVQVSVETVTTILAFLILRRIPAAYRKGPAGPDEEAGRRARVTRRGSIAISAALGVVVAGAMVEVREATGDEWLGRRYIDLAPRTGADDVVTAILVDFRSLDTLGEIAVFGVSAIGAVLLLSRRRKARKSHAFQKGDGLHG